MSGYSRAAIFTLPWETRHLARLHIDYCALALPNVHLEFRIHICPGQRYEIWQRHQQEKPWQLGQASSLEEAKFHVYDTLCYFKLYKTGTWDPHTTRRLHTPTTYQGAGTV